MADQPMNRVATSLRPMRAVRIEARLADLTTRVERLERKTP
ncbi:hypothetical protein [Methylobacterium sp.]|jgi:hypothetical protein|nr:hypothetical protein [Methylobacterium sp.]